MSLSIVASLVPLKQKRRIVRQVMEGEDKFACDGCGEKTRAHSRSSFTHLPNYLLLHLALFTYENGANVKRMEKVELVNPLLVHHHGQTRTHVSERWRSRAFFCFERAIKYGLMREGCQRFPRGFDGRVHLCSPVSYAFLLQL